MATIAKNFWRDVFLRRVGLWSVLYLMLLPTIISMLVFDYYPKIDVVIKSFYRWQPPDVDEYVGIANFRDAFADPIFWQSFELVGILLVTNLLKMWPGIIVAIALHRLLSDRWRYYYQVMFVIPMVIPGMVWLLIWKSFYDPDFGLLNRVLNATGMMQFLAFLDGSETQPGLMPRIASGLEPILVSAINPVFGNVWGLILAGGFILCLKTLPAQRNKRLSAGAWVLGGTLILPIAVAITAKDGAAGFAVGVAATLSILFGLARSMPGKWILYPFLILGGLVAFAPAGDFPRLPLLFIGCFAVSELLRIRLSEFVYADFTRWAGIGLLTLGCLFLLFGKIWTEPTSQFIEGTPAWLGNKDLIIPALLFWGFPWVGTVGVLIYLSGLQQISQDVYEAAEIDGVSPAGMLFRIELPLIMTQVRINLIFLTIGTLTGYEMFLILLGSDGGPANRGMVPGLYQFKKAFEEGQFGYACALGMVLFVMILLLTIIYNRYVKVEK